MRLKLFKNKTITTFLIIFAFVIGLLSPLVFSTKVSSLPAKQLEQVAQNRASSYVGTFKLIYEASTYEPNLPKSFQDSGIFAQTVNDLNNQNLNLPVDIPITFKDCGMANAFYYPAEQAVTMCYELFGSIATEMTKLYSTEAEAYEKAAYTEVFVLYHEVGHALTDILQLTVTGREEDAVDDFASILLLRDNNPQADNIVLNASLYFNSHPDGPYWGEHSFGQQRFYNIICLLYGRNPSLYADIPEKAGLGDRTPRCPGEYQQKLSSWERILAPHSIFDVSSPDEVPGADPNRTPQPLF